MYSTAFSAKHRLYKHEKSNADWYEKRKRKKDAQSHGQPNNKGISAEPSLARAEQTVVKCAAHWHYEQAQQCGQFNYSGTIKEPWKIESFPQACTTGIYPKSENFTQSELRPVFRSFTIQMKCVLP